MYSPLSQSGAKYHTQPSQECQTYDSKKYSAPWCFRIWLDKITQKKGKVKENFSGLEN